MNLNARVMNFHLENKKKLNLDDKKQEKLKFFNEIGMIVACFDIEK